MSLTQHAHEIISAHFSGSTPKRCAVDATCGNGHDTLFLCQQGFQQVFGFDIQAQAISASKERLENQDLSARLIHSGHEKMDEYIEGKIDCVLFNFGYLPKADKSLTTNTATSLKAISIATEKLSDSGLISLMCYPGHPEGAQETAAIKEWLTNLDKHVWQVDTHLSKSPKASAPILFLITKQCA